MNQLARRLVRADRADAKITYVDVASMHHEHHVLFDAVSRTDADAQQVPVGLDHLAANRTAGHGCVRVRAGTGRSYCEEDEPKIKPNIYCYKTLAKVTCYDRPDPYGGRQKKMGVDNVNVAK